MKRGLTLATLAAAAGLALTGCAPTGWEGEAHIIELEYLDVEQEGEGAELEDLEVSAMDNQGRERSVVVNEACSSKLKVGEKLAYQKLIDRCGEPDHSYDD